MAALGAAETTAKKSGQVAAKPAPKAVAKNTGTASKSSASKSATSKSVPSKTGQKSGTASAKGGSQPVRPSSAARNANSPKLTKGKGPARPVAVARRYRQTQPTADRYKEIQEALATQGYLKSEPNGIWDAESTQALKKFQTDRNLTATGKITAPALIELGLGPRNQPMGSPPVPAAETSGNDPSR